MSASPDRTAVRYRQGVWPPVYRVRRDSERRILEVVRRMITEGQSAGGDGYTGITVARVAARAGCSRYLIHKYFGTIEQLLTAAATK